MSVWHVAVLTVTLLYTPMFFTNGYFGTNSTAEEPSTKHSLLRQDSFSSKKGRSRDSVPLSHLTAVTEISGIQRYPKITNPSASIQTVGGKFAQHTSLSNGNTGPTGDKSFHDEDSPEAKAASRSKLPSEYSTLAPINPISQPKGNTDTSDAERATMGLPSTEIDNFGNPVQIKNCNFTLTDLGDLCTGPSWSCRDRCGEDSYIEGESRQGSCQCSHRCLVYGSCCEDFSQECPAEQHKAIEEFEKFDRTEAYCSPFLVFKLIRHCPIDYPQTMTRFKCEDIEFWYSIELNFPVTDSLSGHHFRNKACWECWQGRNLSFNEPLTWNVSVNLPLDLQTSLHFDLQTFINKIYDNPDISKSWWRPPNGYAVYYCYKTQFGCSGCYSADVGEKCMESQDAVVQVDEAVHKNRYCYFCSDQFLLNREAVENSESSVLVSECKKPESLNISTPEYNMFDFTMTFSLSGSAMRITSLDDRYERYTFSWSSLLCREGDSSCSVIECVNGIPPQNGRCNENLQLSILWVYVCFGVSSAKQAAKRTQCANEVPRQLSTDILTESVWPGLQDCLEAGPVDQYLRVTNINIVKESPQLEIHIYFVHNVVNGVGQGDVRLRNCALLAFSSWLHSVRHFLIEASDVMGQSNPENEFAQDNEIPNESAEKKPNPEYPSLEDIFRNHTLDSQSKSHGEKKEKAPSETYVCLRRLLMARFVGESEQMGELDCFLALNMADQISRDDTRNHCRGLRRTETLVVIGLMLLLALAICFTLQG